MNSILSKFTEEIPKEKFIHSLLGRLMITFSLLLVLSLSICNISTYFITKANVIKDFKNSSTEVAEQTKNYIEVMCTTVDSVYAQLYSNKTFMDLISRNDLDEPMKEERRELIGDELTNIAISNTFNIISGITFYSNEGLTSSFPKVPRTTSESDEQMNSIKQNPWYENVIKRDGKSYWLSPHEEKIVEGRSDTYLSSIILMKDNDDTRILGVIKIDIKVNVLNHILDNTNIGDNGYIFIIDEDGKIVAHKDGDLAGSELDNKIYNSIINSESGDFEFKDGKIDMCGISVDSEYNNWKYIVVVPENELFATATNIQKYTLVITLICLVLCFVITVIVSFEITKPIHSIIGLTKKLANGDLTIKSDEYKIVELDLLGSNFNKMTNKLNNTLKTTTELANETDRVSSDMAEITERLKNSSKEITSAIQEITVGSNSQVESTMDCAQAAEDLSRNINDIITEIKDISVKADNCISVAKDNKTIIGKLNEDSKETFEVLVTVINNIAGLSQSTKDILNILREIDDISEQTNLLALNAAIEAARAGEVGKGFSVVADEIRKLSYESKKSSIEIEKKLRDISERVSETISTSNNAKTSFDEEMLQVSKTVEAFEIIGNQIESVVKSISGAINNLDEIERKKEFLSNNIKSISDICERNAAATQEVMASVETEFNSSEEMNDIAQLLSKKSKMISDRLESFNLGGEE